MTKALFTKVNGRWRFEGFLLNDGYHVGSAEFARTVEREIRETKDSPVPTEAYKIVELA